MYILKNQIVLRRNGKMSTLTIKHMPYGDMAIIAMRGCEEFASKVDCSSGAECPMSTPML